MSNAALVAAAVAMGAFLAGATATGSHGERATTVVPKTVDRLPKEVVDQHRILPVPMPSVSVPTTYMSDFVREHSERLDQGSSRGTHRVQILDYPGVWSDRRRGRADYVIELRER